MYMAAIFNAYCWQLDCCICVSSSSNSATCVLQAELAEALCCRCDNSDHVFTIQNKDKDEAKNASKEAPAASDKPTEANPTPVAPSSPKLAPTQTLQVVTALHAQQFYKQYFSGANSPSTQTDGMRQLSSICAQLSLPGKSLYHWVRALASALMYTMLGYCHS